MISGASANPSRLALIMNERVSFTLIACSRSHDSFGSGVGIPGMRSFCSPLLWEASAMVTSFLADSRIVVSDAKTRLSV